MAEYQAGERRFEGFRSGLVFADGKWFLFGEDSSTDREPSLRVVVNREKPVKVESASSGRPAQKPCRQGAGVATIAIQAND